MSSKNQTQGPPRVGDRVLLTDHRTGARYWAIVRAVKPAYGRWRISVAEGRFFNFCGEVIEAGERHDS